MVVLEGALQPPHQFGVWDICYLAGADDHVIRSWLQLHRSQSMPQTAFDPVSSDRIAGALRDYEPDTRNTRFPGAFHHHDATRATSRPLLQDPPKVTRVTKGFEMVFEIRQRDASDPCDDAL